ECDSNSASSAGAIRPIPAQTPAWQRSLRRHRIDGYSPPSGVRQDDRLRESLFDKPGVEMSSKDELKRAVCEAIDRHADTIIDLGDTILRNPETGFNEVKTAALVAQHMTALGLEPRT